MTCGIYEIVNKQENRSYIGQSMDIERRWKTHLYMNPLNTCNNLLPTLELYHENPELVDFSIIQEIPDFYQKEELSFILSIYEKHELELRGGPKSENVINVMPISIPAVPPSILDEHKLPSFTSVEDVVAGISKWNYEQRFRRIDEPSFEEKYFESLQIIEDLEKKLEDNIISPKVKMSQEYEVFRLKQRIAQLEDENAELNNRVDFWKERCAHWRNLNGE